MVDGGTWTICPDYAMSILYIVHSHDSIRPSKGEEACHIAHIDKDTSERAAGRYIGGDFSQCTFRSRVPCLEIDTSWVGLKLTKNERFCT